MSDRKIEMKDILNSVTSSSRGLSNLDITGLGDVEIHLNFERYK